MTSRMRQEALNDLLLLRRGPISGAIERLKSFPWDSEDQLVTLTRSDALQLLKKFESGALTAGECEAWANALEGRDDVGFEEGAENVLKDFLFELATPEVARKLTQETASDWRRRLG